MAKRKKATLWPGMNLFFDAKEEASLKACLRHALDSELDVLDSFLLDGKIIDKDGQRLARYSVPMIKRWLGLYLRLKEIPIPESLERMRARHLRPFYNKYFQGENL
jgi:hypothetical protein